MKRREFFRLVSGAAASSFPASAQQSLLLIGFLQQGAREPAFESAFRQGVFGTVGRDITIEYRWAEGRYDQLPILAMELVDRRVAVIAAAFLPAALAAKSATQTIPIVFLSGSDPIGSGLVSSISRPTGNVTGIAPMFTLLGGKDLEVLKELVPSAAIIGALAKTSNPNAEPQLRRLQTAASTLGQELMVFGVENERDIDSSFAVMVQRRIGALAVTADGFLISRRDQIVGLASHYALPTMYPLSQYVVAGGLVSYGADLPDAYRQTGIYVGKILGGAKPTDLPVLQPTKVELVINLKTAKSLGLTVPPAVLARADRAVD